MQKKFFFLPLLAALVMAGCSKEDSDNGGGSGEEEVKDRYIAFNIVASGSNTGRAETDDFEVGSEAENKAEKALFLFFDAGGVQTQSPVEADLTWTSSTSDINPAVEKISQAVVVVAGTVQPTQVLVVLNPTTTAYSSLNGFSLTQCMARFGKYNISTAGQFIMTNASYNDGTKDVCATDITGKAAQTQQEAEAAPVDIYVERVVAKANVKPQTGGITITPTADLEVYKIQRNAGSDELIKEKITITPKIVGIELANLTARSFLFKNLTESGTSTDWRTLWSGWNDAANKRSYWAICPSGVQVDNNKWSAITANASKEHTYYLLENTLNGRKTSVLVTAQLTAKAAGATESSNVELVKWGAQYYLKESFLKQYASILHNANYREMYTDAAGTNQVRDIAVEYLQWISADEHKGYVEDGSFKAYQTTAKIVPAENMRLRKYKGEGSLQEAKNYEEATAAEINAFLREQANRCWLWNEGKCYYYAEIEHIGLEAEGYDFSHGVVRNHVYKLTLQTLGGLGTPVFNPEEVIIPEKPVDNLWYLSAKINILKWRIVNQGVNFK